MKAYAWAGLASLVFCYSLGTYNLLKDNNKTAAFQFMCGIMNLPFIVVGYNEKQKEDFLKKVKREE